MSYPNIVQTCAIPARLNCRLQDLRDLREKLIAIERDCRDGDVAQAIGVAIEDMLPIVRMLEKAHNIAALNASIAWTKAVEAKEATV